MRPLKRHSVNKSGSSRSFRNQTRKTKHINIAAPSRGGIRL